jgi:phage minor structural protein
MDDPARNQRDYVDRHGDERHDFKALEVCMSGLYVYEPWPDAVDTNGLCGALTPRPGGAKCTQEDNGDFRLDIDHPIDPAGKWTKLVEGNLIRANVPLRTVPEFDYETGAMLATVRQRTVTGMATRAQRAVYNTSIGGVRMYTLEPGAIVYQNATFSGASRRRVRWSGGCGFVDSAALDAEYTTITYTPGSEWVTPEWMESLAPSPRSRPQLFRIDAPSFSESGIKVSARQVFYDQLGDMVSHDVTGTNPLVALAAIKSGLSAGDAADAITYNTNLYGTKTVSGWKYVSPVEVILSPSNGLLSLWNGEILRDNWGAVLLTSAGVDRGYSIEYAKNLKGVTFSSDYSDIVSRLHPVGQTSKGAALYVVAGSYTTAYGTITTMDSTVRSSHDGDYAIPHFAVLDKGSEIKAAGTTAAQLLAARTKLVEAAMSKFLNEQCDLPQITLKVDFLMLGDTVEFAQYRDLQKLFLYDTVRVRHPGLGIDMTAKINRTVWDCSLDRYIDIELGSVRRNYARSKFAEFMVPGLSSLNSRVDTISGLV